MDSRTPEIAGLRQQVAELKEEVASLRACLEALKEETRILRRQQGNTLSQDTHHQAIRDLRTERCATC
ncbi:MAG: hypothetical protein CAPSK01_001748 [Candidatus Accumulibacter vicinus]|uniref:Uncharacterized protein n=1 Tax=Candidatus Accumulibacter vicinus TaxID=2954382 RepID=A0A084Y2E9_9PROT|nr:MAG: hypothetical protein CAPSK01_001748 [Candidatus Accumulibacter vicinus]